jgi:hypothetical protein
MRLLHQKDRNFRPQPFQFSDVNAVVVDLNGDGTEAALILLPY